MKELVTIALKNDKGEWRSVNKTNTFTSDDVFTNKRGTENITIYETPAPTAAEFCEEFDVYAYRSEKEYNEVELAYLTNDAMNASIYSEKEPLVLYYGTVNNEKKPQVKSKVTALTTDGSFIQTVECQEELTELDIIDLAAFKCAEFASMKNNEEQAKTYSK